jgi:hypothetical protein
MKRGPVILIAAVAFLPWILVPCFVSELQRSGGVGDIAVVAMALAFLGAIAWERRLISKDRKKRIGDGPDDLHENSN